MCTACEIRSSIRFRERMNEAAGFVQMKGVGSSFQCAMYASMCSRSATLLGQCATSSRRRSARSRSAAGSDTGRQVGDFRCEFGVAADLVRSNQVRLQPVRAQHLRDRRTGEIDLIADQSRRPPRAPRRRRRQRHLYDALDDLRLHSMISSAGLRLIGEPFDAVLDESPSDAREMQARSRTRMRRR